MEHPDPNQTRELPEVGEATAARCPVLVVIRGPHLPVGTEFPLSPDVTSLGRQPDSTVTLDDVTVSRRHAEIRRYGEIFVLRDHGSLNGTYLNRRPIDEARLVDGDEVQVGKYRLTFRTDGSREL